MKNILRNIEVEEKFMNVIKFKYNIWMNAIINIAIMIEMINISKWDIIDENLIEAQINDETTKIISMKLLFLVSKILLNQLIQNDYIIANLSNQTVNLQFF